MAPAATRVDLRKRWAAAKTALANHGSKVADKLPSWLRRKKRQGKEPSTSSAPTDSPRGQSSETTLPTASALTLPLKLPLLASSEVGRDSSNATVAGFDTPVFAPDKVATADDACGAKHAYAASPTTHATPGLRVAQGGAAVNETTAAQPGRRRGSSLRGAAGLTQHASRGRALETSGAQKELDQIAELTAPWEILVLTPKLLRQAVSALGAELTGILDAAAAVQSDQDGAACTSTIGGAACTTRQQADAWEGHAADGEGPSFDQACACRWDRAWRERAAASTAGGIASDICWCGLQQVVGEVLRASV